ncbi:MAG: hypothetical protein Crog4KO_36290 [Crocinitomicaceae bacterium]
MRKPSDTFMISALFEKSEVLAEFEDLKSQGVTIYIYKPSLAIVHNIGLERWALSNAHKRRDAKKIRFIFE